VNNSYPTFVASLQHHHPFGMLLVDRNLAAGSDYKYGFNGKENDDEIAGNNNALDFGARIYDVRLGRWLSVDPVLHYNFGPYCAMENNPISKGDPYGRDAIILIWNNYPSGGWALTGHAGVLLIDNVTGMTKYYEYGRYDADKIGQVMTYSVPNVVMGDDGRPSAESLHKVLKAISEHSATTNKNSDDEKTWDLKGAYFISEDFDEMKEYADERLKENLEPNREEYNLINNNCGDFACDIVRVADDVPDFWITASEEVNSDPSMLIEDLQKFDDFSIDHSTEVGYTTVGDSDKYCETEDCD